ncbi:odorant receptor 2a-like [Metopolophium dirhodum]|uniref:odorant receptor 2a-like n=1 Tax=Metopolophium dirhodum TaxID=44670 RepID=UPI0029900AED|nr:odorant receptor 2a-like [Metopolophium dirhodum]
MTTTPRVTGFTAPASEDLTIVDNGLFKAICLHQILDPAKGGNRYYRLAFMVVMWVSLSVQIIQSVGLYFAVNDLQRFAFTTTMIFNALLCLSKGYVLVTNADRVRASLEVARYGFTSSGARDQRLMRRSRAVLSTVLRTFAVLSWVTCFIWALTPLFAMDEYLQLTNANGTVSRYRVTIYNVWLPVPATVYNETIVWSLVYAVEVVVCFVNVFSWLLFDSYVVTMCFTFNAQFRTVAASSTIIGHRGVSPRSPSPHATDGTSDDNNTLNCYDELMNHIKDNQSIIKMYDDFFEIIQPTILFQIIGGSYSVITLIFLTSLTYLMGWSIISIPVLKVFFGFLSVTFELFMYCYVFNHIETEKCNMNFGLYSSNWTAMDLKFKKTLLFGMNTNSSHRRVMKVTPRSIINLEMFTNVMNMSYSIVSILLNSRVQK